MRSTSWVQGVNNGIPEPDDPRRCEGKSRRSGERCKRWRHPGSRFCIRHGGRIGKKTSKPPGYDVANKYKKFVGTTLAKRLEDLESEGNPIKDLTDEIELSRSLLIDALALHERCSALPPGDKRVHAMIEAGRIVQDQLREISDLVVKMAKVEAEVGSIPVSTIQSLISQMTAAIANPITRVMTELGLDPGPLLAECAVAIKNVKTVESSEDIDESVQYADHPALLAEEMDDTVPFVSLSLPAPASPRDGKEQPVNHAAGG